MKRFYFTAIIICALSGITGGCAAQLPASNTVAASSNTSISRAFKNKTSNVQVEGEGKVSRVLSDDLEGSRHQRFILRLASDQTVLIAHNIDLAPKVPGLRKGDTVRFYGEYEWSEKGGTVHWTHRDPKGRHVSGWIKFKGRVYQ